MNAALVRAANWVKRLDDREWGTKPLTRISPEPGVRRAGRRITYHVRSNDHPDKMRGNKSDKPIILACVTRVAVNKETAM